LLAVSTIIPHAGGIEILRECLDSLAEVVGIELEVIIVDNGSNESPSDWGLERFPNAQHLRYECRLGFAVACNRGVEAAHGELIFLLNNDAVVTPDSIPIIAARLVSDRTIAAVQPKILYYNDHRLFDYSSACGGMIDRYGFPFARGRVFDTVEEDLGQHEQPIDCFWGAGAALMIRRNLYLESGGLEEPFFAHMEEIDLLWRMQLMGYRVVVEPSAIAYHRGAVTIKSGSFIKHYLNHRNSLAMMIRNYSAVSLIRFLPVRLAMDAAFAGLNLIRLDFTRFGAVARAWIWILFSFHYLINGRRRVQCLRCVSDEIILRRIYSGSVAWQYFVRRRRTYGQLDEAILGRR